MPEYARTVRGGTEVALAGVSVKEREAWARAPLHANENE